MLLWTSRFFFFPEEKSAALQPEVTQQRDRSILIGFHLQLTVIDLWKHHLSHRVSSDAVSFMSPPLRLRSVGGWLWRSCLLCWCCIWRDLSLRRLEAVRNWPRISITPSTWKLAKVRRDHSRAHRCGGGVKLCRHTLIEPSSPFSHDDCLTFHRLVQWLSAAVTKANVDCFCSKELIPGRDT